jgi:hypothetical protein
MPAITIQQAYALAHGAYINLENKALPIISDYVSVPGLTSTTQNKLQELLNSTAKDLGLIAYTPIGGETAVEIISAADTPAATTYTLVTSTQDLNNNLIEDHKEGGTIDGTQGTLSVAEKWFHITGAGIMKKVKK